MMKIAKNLTVILMALLMLTGYVMGETIASQGFETDLSGYSHTPSQTPSTDPGDQYFYRAEPSNTDIYEGDGPYTNVTGSWLFVGSNPNTINGGSPGVLTLSVIDVTGYSDLTFSADWGACPNDWDSADELKVEYSWDNSSWSTLYYFQVDPGSDGTNEPLQLAGNATGGDNTSNGTVITYALTSIVSTNFTGSGNSLYLKITCNSNANYEAFGVDNIVVSGTPAGGVADPTGFDAATASSSQINLSWTQNGNSDDVMIIYDEDGSFTDPTDGVAYSVSSSACGGTVIYNGSGTSYNHTSLSANTAYYYKAWSVDGSDNYSAGVTDNATTYKVEPSNHAASFVASGVSYNLMSVDWSDNDGVQAADGFLVKASSTSLVAIDAPSDGTAEADDTNLGDGSAVVNVVHGTQTYQFTGLSAATTYYFKIWPYTNSGTGIDYKTDGTIPTVTQVTSEAPVLPNAWINEIHYDNVLPTTTDANEGFEIVIENPGNYTLANFAVSLYNGSGGAVYGTYTLDNFTVGNSADNFTYYYNMLPSNGIQNGAPDGIALSYNGDLIQFLSYEGSFTATDGPANGETSTDIGVSEGGTTTDSQSLQLIGTGTQYSDFTWSADITQTWGASNNAGEQALPITLTSFTAIAVNGTVELTWETASETNNAFFLIYRNNKVIASVDGAGISSEPHSYHYVDSEVVPGVAYTYVLADVDYANVETKYEDKAVTVQVNSNIMETDFTVGAAYPNPFNPTAVIPFELTKDARVQASVYDLVGQEVKALVNGNFSAGSHELQINGKNMTTGIYLVKVVIDNTANIQKIALMK
jgi:hypothetical protein